ncbi:MAG: sterol desaturase family protein [Deltaproteobacteria bacterium]|nr:sterol desaturase family protein [Deltaproteobacteria bacterium]
MAKKVPSTKDETIRLFQNDFLEFFTRVHPITPLVLFLPPILILLYQSFTGSLSILENLLLFVLGVITWSLTEYLLHRFLFHYEPSSNLGKRLVFLFHGIHHDYPNDSKRLVMPPSVSLPIAAILFYCFYFSVIGKIFLAGFGTGYLIYDLMHFSLHHFPMKSLWAMKLKQYHLRHHFKNPNQGYGVSSPLWDWVFRTRPSS